MSRTFRTTLLVSLFAGCGTAAPGGGSDDDVVAIDASDADPSVDGDADDGGPLETTDAIDAADAADADGEDDAADVSVDDVDAATDSQLDSDAGLPDGSACSEDDQCAGLLCLDIEAGEGGGVCVSRCVDDSDCPDESDCVTLLPGGVDGGRVCLANDLCLDADLDGFGFGPGCAGEDCAPDDGNVSPAADELCNGYDDDCNTRIDDNPVGVGAACDTGAPGACAAGRVECGDGIASCVQVSTASDEVCNGVDDDCDGSIDERATDASTFFADNDGDGFGDPAITTVECTAPAGFVANDLDCDDLRDRVSPRGVELCNLIDDDCDGEADDDAADASSWLVDSDMDGFGVDGTTVRGCTLPAGASAVGGDCNDSDDSVRPDATELCDGIDNDCDDDIDDGAADRATFYADSDEDGFGDASVSILACAVPEGFAPVAGDCDDSTADRSPEVAEQPGDQVDQDCDGREICFADADNDRFRTSVTVVSPDVFCTALGEAPASLPATDCDDSTNLVNPSRDELCNDVDDDCDGTVDVGAFDANLYYVDLDGDLWGDELAPVEACRLPAGASAVPGDCNDDEALISPSADEVCDGLDNNCDDIIDTDATDRTTFFRDFDGDTFGDLASTVATCAMPDGYVVDATDCDDSTAARSPAAAEIIADQIDQDCDGGEICYVDADGDGYRINSTIASVDALCAAEGEAPSTRLAGDCDDRSSLVNPGRVEICNGVDDDCVGGADVGAVDAPTFFVDFDSDSWGDASSPLRACTLPEGASARSGDCDDRNLEVSPSAVEVCDGVDNNCSGGVDLDAVDKSTFYRDADLDTFGNPAVSISACSRPAGYVADATDCDDTTSRRSPATAEVVGNQIDEDCNGGEICYVDGDSDGYRVDTTIVSLDALCDAATEAPSSRPSGDCDDTTAAVNPGRNEVCNGVDDDCNEGIDERLLGVWYVNSDGDPFGDASRPVSACTQPGGTSAASGDCNDSNNTIYPGASDAPGDNVDSNCNGSDTCFADADNDGVRTDSVISSPDVACDAFGEAWAWESANDCNDGNGTISPLAGEACNAVDDNCNAAIDDTGGACTVPVIRSFGSYHFYTTSLSEAGCCGFTIEQNPAFYLYSSQVPGTAPFYRCRSESLGRHMYTTDPGCEGYPSNEGIMGYISVTSMPGSVNLHRLYRANRNDHLFTVSDTEIGSAQAMGYVYEGVVGQVFMSPR